MKAKSFLLTLSMAFGAGLSESHAAISLVDGVIYSQNFNSLASTGTTGSTLPVDWVFSESGTNANSTYGVGTGSNNAGNTYSFGSTGDTDRSFGGLLSGSLVPIIGASFINNVGVGTIDITISYTGEQWRLGATGRTDRLDFQYSTNATSLTTGTWTDINALDFTAPVTAGTVGALNGNSAVNRTAISTTVTTVSIANGATFWIRWTDFDAPAASDDGLAIDDFSIKAVPEPGAALIGAFGVIGLLRRRRY